MAILITVLLYFAVLMVAATLLILPSCSALAD